jgi:hypothetical protein
MVYIYTSESFQNQNLSGKTSLDGLASMLFDGPQFNIIGAFADLSTATDKIAALVIIRIYLRRPAN